MSTFTRIAQNGRLTSTCVVCGVGTAAPDKGLGRATVAAWESRHHCST